MRHDEERQKAKAFGLKRYFNGRMCKHGHVAERLTSCGRCIECHRDIKHRNWKFKKLGKRLRTKVYGYDPFDLRMRRKDRKLGLSNRPDLVALRERRKAHGRMDQKSKRGDQTPC